MKWFCKGEHGIWAGCGGKQKQTNDDRIRSMTDEELARLIASQRGWFCNFKDPTDDEYPKVLEWLQAESGEA